jgi:hypothetical protein
LFTLMLVPTLFQLTLATKGALVRALRPGQSAAGTT